MAVSVLTAGGAITAPAASAEPIGPIGVRVTNTVNVKSTQSGYRSGTLVATCSAGVGGTCTLSRTVSATRTINLSLNVSRAFVAGKLGWSSASSTSVTASCTSPKFTSSRQIYRGYVQGTRKTYTITRKIYIDGKLSSTTTSGTLIGFNPTGVACVMGTR